MKAVKEIPLTGQFVAVWEHNNLPWSDTLEWKDGKLKRYGNPLTDNEWAEDDFHHDGNLDFLISICKCFIIQEE